MTKIIAHQPMPKVAISRMIWQPVTDRGGTEMRLAPLDWQPSGAHHALEYLAAENIALKWKIYDMENAT